MNNLGYLPDLADRMEGTIMSPPVDEVRAMQKDAERYQKVKKLTLEQYQIWRWEYGCSDEALDEL